MLRVARLTTDHCPLFLVGAAGIEPATTGLENLRAYSLPRYPCVFSIPSVCALVQLESFGCDLLRGVGHDLGHTFLRRTGVLSGSWNSLRFTPNTSNVRGRALRSGLRCTLIENGSQPRH